jgi:hypothetical protein
MTGGESLPSTSSIMAITFLRLSPSNCQNELQSPCNSGKLLSHDLFLASIPTEGRTGKESSGSSSLTGVGEEFIDDILAEGEMTDNFVGAAGGEFAGVR